MNKKQVFATEQELEWFLERQLVIDCMDEVYNEVRTEDELSLCDSDQRLQFVDIYRMH